MRSFIFFCFGGGIAFVIDAGLTQGLVSLFGGDPWSARAIAFPVAVTFTWFYNKTFTFPGRYSQPLWFQWSSYAATQIIGWLLNLGCYIAIVATSDIATKWPVIGVAIGSMVGLIANYLGAKHIAFRQRKM